MSRIQLNDTSITAVSKMTDGNIGALQVCLALIRDGGMIDPQAAFEGFGKVMMLDTYEIYGESIWLFYKDICGQDVRKMCAIIRAVQLGLLTKNSLIRAINHTRKRGSFTIPVDELVAKVEEQLPQFKRAPREQTEEDKQKKVSLSEWVREMFSDSMFTQEEVAAVPTGQLPENTVAVEGIRGKLGFHRERLEKHRQEVIDILKQMPPQFFKGHGYGYTFLALCETKDGVQWGEHINVEQLCALAIGLNLGEWCLPREAWPLMPGGMPYIVFDLDPKPKEEPAGEANDVGRDST